MKSFDQILLSNKAWAIQKKQVDASYFQNLSLGQQPKYLWVGCSDSRVPETEITGTEPGEIFVHRNIANQIRSTDPNFMSVLKYAVDHLKVEHIIICGHYKCGGVLASLNGITEDYLGDWLGNVKSLARQHNQELMLIADESERANRLSELSVEDQVNRLSEISIIQQAVERNQNICLHGWIFDIHTGELKVIKEIRVKKHLELHLS